MTKFGSRDDPAVCEPSQMSARILVLEDDPQLRNILTAVLKHQGYEVKGCERGMDAVDLALQESFDLIIADIRMEGIDGLEAVRLTKEQQPGIGSLIVSGYATQEETSRAEQLQVGGYLKKPFKTAELLERVRSLLAEKATAAHRQSQGDIDRDCVLWSLRRVLQLADQAGDAGPPGWLLGVTELAKSLGATLGIVPEVAEELSLGAGLVALNRATNEKLPNSLRQSNLLTTFRVIFGMKPDQDDSRLESLLVELAVAAQEQWRAKGKRPTAAQLAELYPQRFPPPLLDAYSQQSKSGKKTQPNETLAPSKAGVSAYSLGLALERGGDLEGAQRVYQQLAAQRPVTATTVRSMLSAGRLALFAGKAEDALTLVDSAHQESAKFGPTIHSLTLLERGLMLAETQKKNEAIESLNKAISYLETLGLWSDWCRGLLRLNELGQSPSSESITKLQEVAQKPGSPLLGKGLATSLPSLLMLYQSGALDSPTLFGKILNLAPKQVELVLPGLQEDHRRTLVQAFLDSEQACPEDLRRVFEADEASDIRELGSQLPAVARDLQAPQLLRFYSLGVFQLFRGETRVCESEFKTQKNRYLLAYLASDGGKPRQVDSVIEMFWPDKGQKGRFSLNWAVSVLRGLFQDPHSKVVIRESDRLYLDPKVGRWHDLDELEEAIKAARRAEKDSDLNLAWRSYRKVAELYQGRYLEGCYLDWALARQENVEEIIGEALLRLASIAEKSGQIDEASSAMSQLLEYRPHSQRAHLLKIQLLTKSGQPEAAVAHYRKCEEVLRLEYEMEPSTDIIRAYHEARLAL